MAFGLAETAKLAVDLSLKGNFASSLATSEKALGRFDKAITNTQGRAYKAGQQIGTGIKSGAIIAAAGVGFLVSQVAIGLQSLAKLDDVVTQTNAALKSTKAVSGQTAAAIRDLANKYEDLNATIDDTVIQSGENLLLTFTNIRKQAFEPTLQAALDMNQALGGGEAGLSNTIRILGKALNDPLKGLTALQRVGVRFTDEQKAQIAAALKANDTFKAQGIILAELNKRFGGSFLAGGSTTTGKIAKFRDAIDDLQRVLATAMLPVIGKVSDKLARLLSDPKVIKTVNDLGQSIAGLFSDKNLAEGGKILGTLFETAKTAAPVLKETAVATLNIVKAAVSLFTSLPKEIQQLAIGAFAVNKLTGGLVTNIGGALAGGIADFLAKKFTGGMNVNAGVVNVNGAGGIAGGAGAVASGGKSTVGKIVSAASKVFIVGAAVGVFAELAGILRDQSAGNKQQAVDLDKQTQQFTGGASLADLKQSLAGVDQQIADLKGFKDIGASLAFSADIDGVRTAINKSRSDLVSAITREEQRSAAAQVHAVERAEAAINAAKAKNTADTRSETAGIRNAIRAKNLSVTNYLSVKTSVSLSETIKTQTTFKKISGFIQS